MNAQRTMFRIYGRLKRLIAPELRYSQDLYEETLKSHLTAETAWLDLGCGHQVLPPWRAAEEQKLVARCRMIVGIDYDFDSLLRHQNLNHRVRGTITRLPFADNSFDLVTANMVVEHLDQPEEQFREVGRVLKPGGVFIFHTPNARGYATRLARLIPGGSKAKLAYILDGREENDVFDTFYRANTEESIGHVAAAAGFEVCKIRMLVSDAIFGVVPPLAALELLWIKLLMTRILRPLRTTIIAVLRPRAEVAATEREHELREAAHAVARRATSGSLR
jgi:SAM-dependent methyltransferase